MDVLCAPIKRAGDLDLVRPMKSIIASAYSTSDNPADFDDAVQQLNKLRLAAVHKCYDKVEASLQVLYRYHDQLLALEHKVPASEVLIYFKWKDALAGGAGGSSWLPGMGRSSLTLPSFGYERVCVLYNIAALHSHIAAAQSLNSDDGLKLAARMLQQSANTFAQLRTLATSVLGNSGDSSAASSASSTGDLRPDSLTALSALMLAQSQEVFVLKAARDQMKPAVVARLCAQCADYYSDAVRAFKRDSVRGLFDRDWLPLVVGKQALYEASAQFHQSRLCNADKVVGEEIARLQYAELWLTKSPSAAVNLRSSESALEACRSLTARVTQALADARKDNDFIYHERVPDTKTLTPVDRAAVAKLASSAGTTSAAVYLSGGEFVDLFARLTAVHIQQAMAGYDVRKTALVGGEVRRLREATQTLNAVLTSLNLPAALEDTGSGAGAALPPSIAQKAADVRQHDGLAALERSVATLPELLQRNREVLTETRRMLDEERDSDQQLRAQLGANRWTRTPSDKLTESLRANLGKYSQIIENAVRADSQVSDKLSNNRHAIQLLSGHESQLIAALSSCQQSTADTSSSSSSSRAVDEAAPAVKRLHSLMDRVVQLKLQRDQLESRLKAPTTDLKATFLQALQPSSAGADGKVIDDLIERSYGPLRAQVSASCSAQEQLVAEIQSAHEQFSQSRAGSDSGGEEKAARERMLRDLASGYDVFCELRANLTEGTKFYGDLTQLLLQLQNKVTDFCFARKTEKDELLKDLTVSAGGAAASSKASTPDVTIPAHVQQATGGSGGSGGAGKAAPPARPPQPDLSGNPYAGASTAPAAAAATAPLPYPVQPQTAMPQPYTPYPYYTPMPMAFNPYATFPGAVPGHYGQHPPPAYQQQQQHVPYPPASGYPAGYSVPTAPQPNSGAQHPPAYPYGPH